MPMNTMFVMGGSGAAPGSPRAAALDSQEARRRASTTCSMIWAVLSCALHSKDRSAKLCWVKAHYIRLLPCVKGNLEASRQWCVVLV